MLSYLPNIEGIVLEHMIRAAERVLAEYQADVSLSVDRVLVFELLVAEMYTERRIFLEDMMQLPFTAAKSNA